MPWALYLIDRPAPKVDERRIRSIYRGRAAQVLHALLLEPDHSWHVQELATRAEVSPYTVHQVLTYLEDQLWVEKRGAGPHSVRILREPGALLDAWAAAYSLAEYRFQRFHHFAQSPELLRGAVTAALDQFGVPYALSLASGAALVAPFSSTSQRLSLLVPVDAELAPAAEAAGLRPVDEGENVVFLVARSHSPLMFRQEIDDVWVASSIQIYLDLWAWPARGKEQASHLRSERLSY